MVTKFYLILIIAKIILIKFGIYYILK